MDLSEKILLFGSAPTLVKSHLQDSESKPTITPAGSPGWKNDFVESEKVKILLVIVIVIIVGLEEWKFEWKQSFSSLWAE